MIPYDLVYQRPRTLEQAVRLFEQNRANGLESAYYAGGTEILSFIRRNRIRPDALIDIKEISECRSAGRQDGHVVLGAALSLDEVIDSGLFPLLSAAGRRIADHTVRNRLTLGGNLCGRRQWGTRVDYPLVTCCLLKADGESRLALPGACG